MTVYVLIRQSFDHDSNSCECRVIGVYASRNDAIRAIEDDNADYTITAQAVQ